MGSFLGKFFQSKKNVQLAMDSLLLGLNSLFFIALVVEQVSFMAFFSVKKVYAIYALLFLLYGFFQFFVVKTKIISQKFITETLWVFAPMVVVLLYGFSESVKFNVLFKLGAGFYLIILSLYLIFKYKKYQKISDFWSKKEQKEKTTSWLIGAVLVLIFIINFSFGLFHLSKMGVVDEALWTEGRIEKYWNNIIEKDWKNTSISDKPGITVALLTGPGLLFTDPSDYERSDDYGRKFNPPKNVEDMNLALRLPILIFTSLSLFLVYFFLRNILGQRKSLLACIFIGLSPILLGMSTIINPDSLLWVFVPLSLLAYFNYQKGHGDKWLYLAGIFLGFSILTKYVANLLYVFFLGMIFWDYIFNSQKYKAILLKSYFKKALLDYFIIVFFSLSIFYLFLPKAWIRIDSLFKGTVFSQAFEKTWPIFIGLILLIVVDLVVFKSKIFSFILKIVARYKKWLAGTILVIFSGLVLLAFSNTQFDMRWFDVESMLASPKSAFMSHGVLGMMISNVFSLIYGISPWALLGLIPFVVFSFKKEKFRGYFLGLSLLFFILIYYFASSVNDVSATVRYQIIIYPLTFIISAIGIGATLKYFSEKKRDRIFWIVSLFLIITGVYSLNFMRPFYFSYSNDLLPEKYVLNLKDMGDGSYEAAEYLNSLPDPENIEIWTDKRGVCMFFVGICRSGIGIEKGEYDIDYFVVSAGRESRTSTMTLNRYDGGNKKLIRLDKLYDETNPEWKLEIGGRPNNFVKVIKVN